MTVVFSRTSVHDYETWSREFESHEEIRTRENIQLIGVFRNAESPNDLLIAIDVPDAEAFGELLKSPEMTKAIRESGISTDVHYWAGGVMPTVTLNG